MSCLKINKSILVLLIFAVLIRLLFFYISLHNNSWDWTKVIQGADGYYEIGQNLVNGHGFSTDITPPFEPTMLRTPLYPLFLAGFFLLFKSYLAVALIQVVIGGITVLLGKKIVDLITPDNKISYAVGIALALEPVGVGLSYALMTETLFTFFFFLFTIFVLKYLKNKETVHIALASLSIGLATLVRPTTQYLPFIIVILIIFLARKNLSKNLIMQGFIFLIIFAAVLSPWLYRNYTLSKKIFLTLQPKLNAYFYLVPSIESLSEKISFQKAKEKFFREEGLTNEKQIFTPPNAAILQKKFINTLMQHPKEAAELAAVTLFQFFTHDRYLSTLNDLGYLKSIAPVQPIFTLFLQNPLKSIKIIGDNLKSPAIIIIVGRALWIVISILFLLGIYKYIINEGLSPAAVFILLLVLYFALTSIVVGLSITGRIRLPVNIFIFFFAIYAIFKKNYPKRTLQNINSS